MAPKAPSRRKLMSALGIVPLALIAAKLPKMPELPELDPDVDMPTLIEVMQGFADRSAEVATQLERVNEQLASLQSQMELAASPAVVTLEAQESPDRHPECIISCRQCRAWWCPDRHDTAVVWAATSGSGTDGLVDDAHTHPYPGSRGGTT